MDIKTRLNELLWVPFKYSSNKGKKNKVMSIILDLKKIGINAKFKFYLSRSDRGLSRHLKDFGFREPIHYRYYYKFVKPNDVILDVGANLGLFSLLSSKAEKIICIEPLKEAIKILKKNLKVNGLSKKTIIINKVVGAKTGKVQFHVAESLNLSQVINKNYLRDYPNAKIRKIDAYALEWFVKKYNTNLLRMDLEGYEYDVLYDKIPKNVNKIDLELHTDILEKDKVISLMNYFEKQGFKVKYLIEDLPMRLYPFYNLLKKTQLIKLFTYVKKDILPKECVKYLFKGRSIKYLILEK